MAVEILEIFLDGSSSVEGSDEISGSGDVNDNQYVTVSDGGDLSGTITFQNWGKDTATETGAGSGGDDIFYFDLATFDDDFTIAVKSMDSGDQFVFTNFDSATPTATGYTFTYTGSDGLSHTITIETQSTNGTAGVDVVQVIICFGRGTGILTETGEVPVEDLQADDKLMCSDGQLRPIRWVGSRFLDAESLRNQPHLQPIRISAGALGKAQPTRDLILSPAHRVLLNDWRAELMFGAAEVLASAKMLVNDSTIRKQVDCQGIEYFHILLDEHQTIFANGLACETLMPAELAKTALLTDARSEILELFPEMAADLSIYGDLCFMSLKAHEVDALLSLGLFEDEDSTETELPQKKTGH